MSQPVSLPDGNWQRLLKHALRLIDEIREHGGVADPFFTFGGGTVLMLRHGHRLSKDIDFFVPDPQSLGYMSPRLSDVAERICDSQYVEANNYIKLFVGDLGEIDIVASPNLLPKEYAFETWTLFGEQIKVETSAEIVAKKMYHRGDRANARDLFDLSLVIEREPDAMKVAQPFFFRHVVEFSNNIRKPNQGFIEQFQQISTLGYTPSLDHATNTVLKYLDELNINHDKSPN